MIATVEPMRPKKEETESVRVSRSVARKARIIAAALNLSVPDYLTDRLNKIIDEEMPDAMTGIHPLDQKRKRQRGD